MPAAKKVVSVKAVGSRLPSLGVQIDSLYQLRERLREIQALEKTQLEIISSAEVVLMETMEREGVDKSTGKLATVSISDIVTANIVDWDAFGAFVIKKKYLHLLQRRVNDPAMRELFEKGNVPGAEPFTKRKLNLRKTT